MRPLRLMIIDPHDIFRRSAYNYALQCREFRSVEVAAGYDEALLLKAQHLPDLILIDVVIFSTDPGIINTLEKLKLSNPKLDVLALMLFKEKCLERCQFMLPLVSGIIFKENFTEGLTDYLAAKHTINRGCSNRPFKGVDQ